MCRSALYMARHSVRRGRCVPCKRSPKVPKLGPQSEMRYAVHPGLCSGFRWKPHLIRWRPFVCSGAMKVESLQNDGGDDALFDVDRVSKNVKYARKGDGVLVDERWPRSRDERASRMCWLRQMGVSFAPSVCCLARNSMMSRRAEDPLALPQPSGRS